MQNSKAKMDEFKSKFMDLLHKQTNRQMKIPAMGFSDYFIQTVTADASPNDEVDATDEAAAGTSNAQRSDQEILESIEECYYSPDSNPQLYELKKVLSDGIDNELIEVTIAQLRTQQKVLTKQVLQNILEQRNACSSEFSAINDTQKKLEESLWTCQKARSYLNFARTNLTTTSLEILASYRKREVLKEVLDTLMAIRKLRTTDVELQKLLADHNYSAAIALLLQCKSSAEAYMQYNCVQSLYKKLQETMLLMEFQLDTVLNEMVLNFDTRKYAKLQEAYKLANKSLMAMDQLHINYISAIHSSVNAVLRGYSDPNQDEQIKLLYEQLCEQLNSEKLIPCLISLCKTFWTILASYYQVVMWHNNYKLYGHEEADSPDIYIQQKLKKGQSRLWNDILTKVCLFLQSAKLTALKYDQFIQVMSIVQRLKKVGVEFCGEQSEKLIEIMQQQSEEFFRRYHICCVEEICLFLDNESWTPVDSFAHILQLPEFRSVRHTLRRHKSPTTALLASSNNSPISNNNCDELVSVHSQDGGSSIYGSYGYFLRFSEKSSPFDGGLDAAMLEEDILSGIVDEASCYFSEESDDEQKSLQSKEFDDAGNQLLVNNTALNVLRCLGRYLQMCKLLHCISPRIVACMLELIDFYVYAVHEFFGKDALVATDNMYTPRLERRLRAVEANVLPQIKLWPLNFSSLANNELANPDTLYGLPQRIVAVEAGRSMFQQFHILQHYLNHLLPVAERPLLVCYLEYSEYMLDLAKPVYTCVTSRVIDLTAILAQMAKVKWDVNHVIHQHSSYSDVLNRNIQSFAMCLEETAKEVTVPSKHVWNSMAHVATHLLVEGFSNVKKCSAGGRALMQLDFANFMSFLELISNQKYPQHRSYVDVFIKTYYFSPEQFEQWIEQQRHEDDYSVKQLSSLIQCICASDKRTRQRLLQLLDGSAMGNGGTPTTTPQKNNSSSGSNLSSVI
ncbi:syndetin [Drosophila guanche]|uniref:Blast:Coiled-coil domain-containing protein 132 n=1 Tax=Drosophila guanche TaxID=7266 RepID=A0A3B0JMW9_DROGU|nr:syndetin [Drosophila guanche]SPP74899.1 blast:Coiled-coil domain-containing protein 132 [Drosophila guanche]